MNVLALPKALAPLMGQALPKALAPLLGQAFLVNRSPKLMLFTIYPDENLINKKCITISLMFFSSIGQYILGQI
jgi:hypothetical protein